MNADPEPVICRVQPTLDKEAARQAVAAMLDGAGLAVRALRNDLEITNPDNPEKGRVLIEYATGHASWQRTVWSHWGVLRGFQAMELADDDETPVDADQIVNALSSRRCSGSSR